jgi:hypothetical protein
VLVRRRASIALGAFLDARKLAVPVTLELAGPVVERPDSSGVRPVEDLTAVATHVDQADVSKHAKVLGH